MSKRTISFISASTRTSSDFGKAGFAPAFFIRRYKPPSVLICVHLWFNQPLPRHPPKPMQTNCFKAYDIRGRIPDDFNEALARRIAYAYCHVLNPAQSPANIIVGRDIRNSSDTIAAAVVEGLRLAGHHALDIGVCGTENVYFATAHFQAAGGVMVTASHNPKDYNGLKLTRAGAEPIGADTGLADIRRMVEDDALTLPEAPSGGYREVDAWEPYIARLLQLTDATGLKPMKILVNPGNGGAGLVIKRLRECLPHQFIEMDFEPDGDFPNGVPNPLLPENQTRTARRTRECGAAFGVAWDGDFDRCFLFDENGAFVNGYYLVGLIAAQLLGRFPGARVVHDGRLIWNSVALIESAGGVAVQSRTGHSFMKRVLREQNAIYGGEVSGHYYFRDFTYSDSGMIPWLLVAGLMQRAGKPLSELVAASRANYPAGDEMNSTVGDPTAVMQKVQADFAATATRIDHSDGVSMEFPRWRFNLRPSNTEPLLRLNVETRGDEALLKTCIERVQGSIRKHA